MAAGPHSGEGEAATAVRLIGLLDLDGALVTGDALQCTRDMTAAIRARGGNYVLALKGNRGPLKAAAEAVLAEASSADTARTEETSNGRREIRIARVAAIATTPESHGFADLSHVAEIIAVRDGGVPTRRLFIASRSLAALDMPAVTRAHWSVENSLHWSLDVIFGEDHLRARKDHAPANIALINRLAKTLLERIDDPKTSIRGRIKRYAWEDQYLTNAISHMQ
ncbi:MAG: ISAs1 family transposase [Sphingomonadales bacterium]|nr:ISAs1 family transposase [Sphingomonadales bacterium]